MSAAKDQLDEALRMVRENGLDPNSAGGAVALGYLLRSEDGGSTSGAAVSARSPRPNADVAPTGTMASWAGVGEVSVLDIFEFGEEGVRLGVGSSRLPASKAERQRVLALLKLAGDRIAFGAEEVAATHINELAGDYACMDQNLPQNLMAKGGWITRRGKRGAYRYRITKPGLEQAKSLVAALSSGGEASL